MINSKAVATEPTLASLNQRKLLLATFKKCNSIIAYIALTFTAWNDFVADLDASSKERVFAYK